MEKAKKTCSTLDAYYRFFSQQSAKVYFNEKWQPVYRESLKGDLKHAENKVWDEVGMHVDEKWSLDMTHKRSGCNSRGFPVAEMRSDILAMIDPKQDTEVLQAMQTECGDRYEFHDTKLHGVFVTRPKLYYGMTNIMFHHKKLFGNYFRNLRDYWSGKPCVRIQQKGKSSNPNDAIVMDFQDLANAEIGDEAILKSNGY